MKTAKQSGWHLTGDETDSTNAFGPESPHITLHSDRGDYLEVCEAFGMVVWYNPDNFLLGDLPQSVLDLLSLWLGIKVVA